MFRLFSRLIVSSVLFPVATLNLFAQSVTNSVPELDYAKNPNHDLVHEVLNDKCFKCHGCNGADKGKFGSILEIENLIQKGKIIPGEPERSILYQKVLSDEMPASGDPLSEENKKLIYDWIGSLKPKPSSAKAQIDVAQTAAASSNLPSNDSWEAETLLAVQNDIISTAPELRKWYRYITLSSLPENSTESDLEVYRQAVSKVVNSLSWAKNIYIPEKVDSRGLILKINMLKIGWTRKSWDALQSQNPFTLPNLSQTPELQDAFEVEIGSKIPVARADWFVSNAIRSHIYYQILNLPKTRLELEEQLGVDLKGDREKNKIIRTGLLKSGVSLNNRVIEYHKGNYGSFWLSHDFEDSKGSHFIFSHPLDFSPDGGEVIFQLPNGMQAYALYNKQAELIDTASKKIVLDPSRPENIVEGGISCFSCHSTGLIYQNDRLKTYAESHRNEFSHEDFDKIGILYNNDAIKGHILNDTKTYQEKLSAAKSLNISRDPLELALNKFESVMDFAKSARELG
ncbi:MAG: hypothetical protein JWQ35_935, partial [Bacteriovoracaceae bacterium]|nr:hypothetical protein [Bacteriovoracaceae bacterium]